MGHRPLTRGEDPNRQIDGIRRRVERLERRYRLGDAIQERKLFADRGALDGNLPDEAILVVAGTGQALWAAAPDLLDHYLVYAYAYVSGVASGDIEVTIRNETQAIDLVVITIPAGEDTSECVIEDMITPDDTPLDLCDEISISVTDDGGGDGEGLFVSLCWRQATPVA